MKTIKQETNRLEGSFVFAKVFTSDIIKIDFGTTSDCPRRAPRLFTWALKIYRKKQLQKISFGSQMKSPLSKQSQKEIVLVHKILACELALL